MEEEINLKEIVKGIWKRKIIIIILAVIALVIGVIISLGNGKNDISELETEDTRVMYAKTSFTVVQTDNFKITETTATTYQHIIKNTQNLERIIEKFDLDMKVSELSDSIWIIRVNYSDIIEIGITNEELIDKSLVILEDITTMLNEELKNTYSINDIYIVQKPRIVDADELEEALENANSEEEVLNEETNEETDSKGKTIVVITLAGIIIGFVVVIGLEFVDGSVKNENQLDNNLAIINCKQPFEKKEDELRKVKLNVKDSKSILITDLDTPEPKDDIANEISKLYAKYGKKVALIDITQNQLDVFSVGANKTKLEENSNNNLVEVLETGKIKEILEKLNEKFDIIIVNGNNISKSINSLKMSEFVDGTICVIETRKTKMKLLKKVMKNLNDINSNLLGTIMVEK